MDLAKKIYSNFCHCEIHILVIHEFLINLISIAILFNRRYINSRLAL